MSAYHPRGAPPRGRRLVLVTIGPLRLEVSIRPRDGRIYDVVLVSDAGLPWAEVREQLERAGAETKDL